MVKTDYVKEGVAQYRAKLLDTSRRNSLVSFRHSDRSRQHVRVIDELPDFLYGEFLDGKKLTLKALPEAGNIPPDEKTPEFLRHLEQAKLTDEAYLAAMDSDEDEEGAPDKIHIERELRNKVREALKLPLWNEQKSLTPAKIAQKHGLHPSYEMPQPTPKNQEDAERHTDKFIQTLLEPDDMNRKLSGLHSCIRTDIEESGVNTLYAAFGFLEWYEAAHSEKKITSPLLLLPLEMKKEQSRKGYTYRVEATGEEAEINLSLSERLRHDFGINLPEFTDEDGPEDYMRKVDELIKEAKDPKKEKWKIRRFITLGRFRFERLVMFHDLTPEKWPGNHDVSTNEIVQSLFASSQSESGSDHAEDYDIDTPEVERAVPLLITPADASQHSALVDVMKGNNMAIKGPPGTGKSQTITNIIANALATGKSVLFLAEKMAALNVVHERLSAAHLGPYCLELHSTKAKKAEILKSIKERLEPRAAWRNKDDLASKMEDFKRHRNHITEYINALNAPFGRQNKPIHDCLWGEKRRKERLGDSFSMISQCKIPFEQADLSASELSSHRDDLELMASLKKEVEAESQNGKHPWGFVSNTDLNPRQQGELQLLIEQWRDGLLEIQSAREAFNEAFGLSVGNTHEAINAFCNSMGDLLNYATLALNEDFIAELGDKGKATALGAFVEQIHLYRSALKEIKFLQNPSAAVDHIQEIRTHVRTAKDMGVDEMTASEIEAQGKDVTAELELWDENFKILLSIGERFGVSENHELGKIYALAEMPDYLASVPRDYLLSRTEAIVDEANAARLKAAFETQERIRANLEEQQQHYDLSMMGKPHELRMHAAALDNAGFFTIFDSSYSQAKKLVKLASKQKSKFDRETSARMLRAIADNQEELEKFQQDKQLQGICGSSFEGMQTNFEKLHQTNEWASSVRKRYGAGNEFFRKVRQWLLKGELEDLDSLIYLANDEHLVALKSKIAEMKGKIAPDTPFKKYQNDLLEKANKLNALKNQLQNIAFGKATTFVHITKDLPPLQNAKKARDAAEQDRVVKEFFGNAYKGTETEIEEIAKTARFIGDCLAIPELAKGFGVFLSQDFSKTWQDFKEQLKRLNERVHETAVTSQEVDGLARVRFDAPRNENDRFAMEPAALAHQLSEALNQRDALNSWVGLHREYAKAANTIKGRLLQIYDEKNLDFDELPDAFEYMIYRAVADEIYRCYPIIEKTSGMSLQQARDRIKKLDQEIMALQQQALCQKLNKGKALTGIGQGKKSTWTEDALLHNEITKQRRHIPIRSLMKRAGQSIQKIKPCFLMSPLTVAQYLEPGQFKFDLIVIDEASQMRPEDALGGIARAKQVVVVGDPQQLPPTSFFQSEGKDEDEMEEDSTSEDIMEKALLAFRPSRILSRHYRSQHESLIAFSNYHFYEQRLVLFPSPVKNPDELGVRLKEVGGTYAANSNLGEAEAVVKEALDFMQKHPDRSLGIATMNQKQKELIESEMDRAFTEHRHAADYQAKWQGTLESFFVKNLESVQGDERDAIFISTVYGPDKNGIVMQRFGPINRATGHRRLNVLFSRAKKNMVVFTSLKPEDIKISENSSKGVHALKGFLAYAKRGVIDEGRHDPQGTPDSDFEIWVKEKLESIGCEVHPQVGVAGYRIDLGVKHPKYPDGYLMGVECDGATYHSSKSARERDVIRQQVLEGLGWRIYRIWSTDWFSNSGKELEKIKNYIQELLNREEIKKKSDQSTVIEHDLTPDEEETPGNVSDAENQPKNMDEAPGNLADAENQPKNEDEAPGNLSENQPKNDDAVELFDSVTYSMIQDDGKKETCVVQIVPTQSNPEASVVSKNTVIGRSLLGSYVGEEIECTLSVGAVTLKIIHIDKPQKG